MTKVELVTKTQGVDRYMCLHADEIVEAVARHGKIKDTGKLIRYLIKHKHWSPLEHVHYSFRIETARDISAQMIRHRSFHWQELSQRYDVIQEFMPIELREQGKTNRQVGEAVIGVIDLDPDKRERWRSDEDFLEAFLNAHRALALAKEAYDGLLKVGVARECARRILPICAKTVVHMTGNLRDFLGYLNVRCEGGTQKEHREIAMGIGEILEQEFPVLKDMDWKNGGFM